MDEDEVLFMGGRRVYRTRSGAFRFDPDSSSASRDEKKEECVSRDKKKSDDVSIIIARGTFLYAQALFVR